MDDVWRIELEISRLTIDKPQLARLEDALRETFPELNANCAARSGRLAVRATDTSIAPTEALERVLTRISSALDLAGIDIERESEVTNVTMGRDAAMRELATSLPRGDSWPLSASR